VVVYDPDPHTRALLRFALGTKDHELRMASRVVDTYEHLPEAREVHPVTRGILVIALRDCDPGLDALCRACVIDWQVPVIAVTAFATTEVEALARQLGASCVFGSPLNVEALRDVVEILVTGLAVCPAVRKTYSLRGAPC
jgi:DNA-binding response OmpR family regulator